MQPILVASTIFLCCSEIFWVYKMKRRDGVTGAHSNKAVFTE